MTPENRREGPAKLLLELPKIPGLTVTLKEGVLIYNPENEGLLTCDSTGLQATARAVKLNISGRSREGWILKIENLEKADGLSERTLSVRWGSSEDKTRVFNNVWELKNSTSIPLSRGGKPLSFSVDEGVVVIPLHFHSKEKNGGGVLVAKAEGVFPHQSVAVIKMNL